MIGNENNVYLIMYFQMISISQIDSPLYCSCSTEQLQLKIYLNCGRWEKPLLMKIGGKINSIHLKIIKFY